MSLGLSANPMTHTVVYIWSILGAAGELIVPHSPRLQVRWDGEERLFEDRVNFLD
jgi:hypothetical protein